MSNIIDFWKSHRDYWITHPSKQQEVDKLICDRFWTYIWTHENLIGQIIYLDQFSRHFARNGLLTEAEVSKRRHIIVDIIKHHLDVLKSMDEIEIIFALMPFKHLKQYDFIFDYLHGEWLQEERYQGKHICDFPDLQRFYIDTYKKAFTFETVKDNVISSHTLSAYDAALICDYYPDKYTAEDWSLNGTINEDSPENSPFMSLKNIKNKVIVSLSGGVDSMVLVSLLKYNSATIIGADVSAVHIIYGNRTESEHEYRFLAKFCSKIGVPLYVYRIKWLRRGGIDRPFYEDMTRLLRFYTYQTFKTGDLEPCILLGHLKEDIIENIWTNIANCHHLDNLKKMEAEEIQYGVRIMRPLLMVKKSDIYDISQRQAIPYLKNSTPSWSNRGKFRKYFHNATIAQFGEKADNKIIEFAEVIQTQNTILNTLLYEPIYRSFKDNCVNISTAVKAKLDATNWLRIFEHICHKNYGISKPSINSIRDFCRRLYMPWKVPLKVVISKKMTVSIIRDIKYDTEFIVKHIMTIIIV